MGACGYRGCNCNGGQTDNYQGEPPEDDFYWGSEAVIDEDYFKGAKKEKKKKISKKQAAKVEELLGEVWNYHLRTEEAIAALDSYLSEFEV